jgi:hypothetical protein
VAHPFVVGVCSAGGLVLLGFALALRPILVTAAAAALSALTILHAHKRGYCPRPDA